MYIYFCGSFEANTSKKMQLMNEFHQVHVQFGRPH